MSNRSIWSVSRAVSVAMLLLIAVVIAWGWYLSWDVRQWDEKMAALCATNGGSDVATRVYETAVAPDTKEYFANLPQGRFLSVPNRREGISLGPQYPYVTETRVVEVLNMKNPSVVKYTERIVRASDNKILAERFGYQRAGGGIPGFDPGEIRTCPKDSITNSLEINVFLNHPRRSELDEK